MTQHEFYNLPAVIEQIEIQKVNKYGSVKHKAAHKKIGDLADEHGVLAEYKTTKGDVYD